MKSVQQIVREQKMVSVNLQELRKQQLSHTTIGSFLWAILNNMQIPIILQPLDKIHTLTGTDKSKLSLSFVKNQSELLLKTNTDFMLMSAKDLPK